MPGAFLSCNRDEQNSEGKVSHLAVTKLRKPEWLAENLDNPFRKWDGSEFIPRGKAKKATEIYKKTRQEILQLAGEITVESSDAAKAQLELLAIAKAYGAAFNKLQGKTDFIETEEREDIYAALEIILADAKALLVSTPVRIDEEALYSAVDEVRDW